jgi:hypothetical protein
LASPAKGWKSFALAWKGNAAAVVKCDAAGLTAAA